MNDHYLELTLGRSFYEWLNDGRVSPRTDHLLWKLETALGELPLGHLLDLLEPSPRLDFGELRLALAEDARAIWEWEHERSDG